MLTISVIDHDSCKMMWLSYIDAIAQTIDYTIKVCRSTCRAVCGCSGINLWMSKTNVTGADLLWVSSTYQIKACKMHYQVLDTTCGSYNRLYIDGSSYKLFCFLPNSDVFSSYIHTKYVCLTLPSSVSVLYYIISCNAVFDLRLFS
jgi:hypothetical protein